MVAFPSRVVQRVTIAIFACLIGFSSCLSPKKAVFFYSVKDSLSTTKPYIIDSVTKFVNPVILPNDVLLISVQTLMQSESNSPIQTARTITDPLTGFLVDKNGNVEISLIGFVHVAGLTTAEARELIKEKAREFYKNPVINVRIINFDIYCLGEFGAKTINIPSEKVNILEAVALAGDISLQGKRRQLLLIRTEGETKKMIRFDLTRTDLFRSPYFYLKQRDILYAEPLKFKVQSADNSITRNIGIISAVASMLTLALSYRNFK